VSITRTPDVNCRLIFHRWHEHDPEEIIQTVKVCISEAVKNLERVGWTRTSIKAIGITNQRETTVAWDRKTGKSLCRAIVWDDARTKGIVSHYTTKLSDQGIKIHTGEIKKGDDGYALIKEMSGLPISTYFSAVKLRWMIHHHTAVQEAYDRDELLFGTIDSWICYSLLGGVHLTDPTNASRTLLLDLETMKWSDTLLDFFDLKPSILPKLVSSSEVYGELQETELKGVKVAGMAGDQQAALVGNKCLKKGEAKCTYGTGAFLLFNTGDKVIRSKHGLLSTVAYQAGKDSKPVYALEGSSECFFRNW
jgi:glycerol kinase